MFVHDGEENIPIDSMPGVARLGWRHGLLDAVKEARSVGVNQVRLVLGRPSPLTVVALSWVLDAVKESRSVGVNQVSGK